MVQDFLDAGALVAPACELPRLTRRFHLVTHALKWRTRGLDLLIGHLTGMAGRGRTQIPHARN